MGQEISGLITIILPFLTIGMMAMCWAHKMSWLTAIAIFAFAIILSTALG